MQTYSSNFQPPPPRPGSEGTPVVKPFQVKWPASIVLQQVLTHRPEFQPPSNSEARPKQIPIHTATCTLTYARIDSTTSDSNPSLIQISSSDSTCLIHETTADPMPLGLIGLGMSMLLLNLHFAGFLPLDAMIVGMGIFCGGVEQIMVGVMAWKKNNIFAATAFSAYGIFWLSLVASIIGAAAGISTPASPGISGGYLSIWPVVSAVIFMASFRHSWALRVTFGLLLLFFILLATGTAVTSTTLVHIAGYAGMLSGFSALYAGFGMVLNELYHKTLLPLGSQHP
ncbi:MAG: acetate uptake transporter [Desulfuromonadaceae bacterium]|nr:acetate uptake transporter [Desulfuromonas sp.]MDY0185830.1 acetate uptake transporter [Desulfuromonadaceae bacterium]